MHAPASSPCIGSHDGHVNNICFSVNLGLEGDWECCDARVNATLLTTTQKPLEIQRASPWTNDVTIERKGWNLLKYKQSNKD
jgi:hypothetical protein